MSEINLLPHNEKAYKKLDEHLKTEQLATINHATGTGKSFIILKYLYKNRNKRILYLSPTYPIIEQLIHDHTEELGININEFNKFDTLIYRTLLDLDMSELASKYDIIVFDEYHRCGAEKWGNKVEELINCVKSNYPNTKLIGTTATETRYLDNNRNMNELLFEGNEVSRLSLADAILEGILPAPVYVNFNYSLLFELERLEKNIDQYAFYEVDRIKYKKILNSMKEDIEETLNDDKSLREYLAGNNKILVFSSTIKNIKKDRQYIEKLLGHVDNTYMVHSNKTKEQNLEDLKEFRMAKSDVTSVLYSVNILNEGVHVKDVDAVCMMRATTSPIIYFQQLGRLLSYSKRNDEVLVLDFVNNIKSNPVIYKLYQEVYELAQKRILENSEQKEKYIEVLKRFKIVNKTSEICNKIENFKTYFSKDSIVERRLNRSIDILTGKEFANEAEKFQAKIDILKYYNYITIEMYDKINSIENIEKPSIFSLSKEEFFNILDGYKNLCEKNRINKKRVYNNLMNFYYKNHRLPLLFSNNFNESRLARSIINIYPKFSIKMKKFILSNITNELSLFEKVSYGLYEKDNTKIDVNRLFIEANKAILMDCEINIDVYLTLLNRVSIKDMEKFISFNLEKEDNDKLNKDTKQDKVFDKNIIFREDFEKYVNKVSKELETVNFDEYIEKLYLDIKALIIKNSRDLEYFMENSYEQELFCKKIIFHDELKKRGYLQELNKISLDLGVDKKYKKKKKDVDRLIEFMNNHNGELPSILNSDKKEIKLAKFYSKNKDKLNANDKNRIYKIQETHKMQKEIILNRYINFVSINRRKPVKILTEEEKILRESFNRWIPYFTLDEKAKIEQIESTISEDESIRSIFLSDNGKTKTK